jgi:hypothetical protein
MIQTVPAPSRRRWPIALALVLTLAIASVLLYLRVPRTEIELEAAVTELSFQLPAAQALTETARLNFLGIAGFGGIDAPAGLDATASSPRPGPSDVLALHASDADSKCRGGITLDRIILPRDAQIWLRRSREPDRIQISLKAPGATIRATLEGCVTGGGRAASRWLTHSPRTLTVQVSDDEVELDIASASAAGIRFAPFIQARDLSFTRIEQVSRDGITLVRRVSTVTSGSLYYQSLNGEERKLRFAEPIRFARSEGDIRSIELDRGAIAVRFHGDVRGMMSGTEANARSVMPTWLEWLKANQSLSLLWGSALYLFGLVVSLLRWWKLDP